MGKKTQLLIADDDSATREMMGAFFREKGYFVFLAENGEEALHLLGEKKIDLVISDYQMPGMDGKELVRRINKFCPSLPVILITGRSLWDGRDTSFMSPKKRLSCAADTTVRLSDKVLA